MTAELAIQQANATAAINQLGKFEELTAAAKSCIKTGLQAVTSAVEDILATNVNLTVVAINLLGEIGALATDSTLDAASTTVTALPKCGILDLGCVSRLVNDILGLHLASLFEMEQLSFELGKKLRDQAKTSFNIVTGFLIRVIELTASCSEVFEILMD